MAFCSSVLIGDVLPIHNNEKGYVFKNSEEIRPYLEKPQSGPTSQFCAELARQLKCYVLAGYPEVLPDHELKEFSKQANDRERPHIVGANSAIFYGPDGEWVGGYRKTNLFETDLSWAKQGAYTY
ncbi:hypothetical protein AMATHDRAFT_48295 [Amanita thiersii Skay4041]|uniref:CN hydrolase domain-containing protein n=1 Tax=Amanita thiersii Skay4041 TaxID=703135 RepID=A0A2A9NQB9_9AGAR|nr:hypothetical protein AMATHDRAFT_48295 [Amanita thiersii Skay4041]